MREGQDQYTGDTRDTAQERQRRHRDILVRRANKSYEWLTRKWGILCKVYAPNVVDTTYQEYDESLGYSADSYFEGHLWIPSAYQERNAASANVIDIFLDSQTIVFPEEVAIIKNSLVIPQWGELLGHDKRGNYRISEIHEKTYSALYRVANIVPSAYNILNNTNDLQEEQLQSQVPKRQDTPRQDQDYYSKPNKAVIPVRPRRVTDD